MVLKSERSSWKSWIVPESCWRAFSIIVFRFLNHILSDNNWILFHRANHRKETYSLQATKCHRDMTQLEGSVTWAKPFVLLSLPLCPSVYATLPCGRYKNGTNHLQSRLRLLMSSGWVSCQNEKLSSSEYLLRSWLFCLDFSTYRKTTILDVYNFFGGGKIDGSFVFFFVLIVILLLKPRCLLSVVKLTPLLNELKNQQKKPQAVNGTHLFWNIMGDDEFSETYDEFSNHWVITSRKVSKTVNITYLKWNSLTLKINPQGKTDNFQHLDTDAHKPLLRPLVDALLKHNVFPEKHLTYFQYPAQNEMIDHYLYFKN